MKKIITNCLFVAASLLSDDVASQPFDDVSVLGVNNISATAGLHGGFWHVRNGAQISSGLEFPKGSGKTLGFGMSLWMAGYDSTQALRATATTYRQSGQEYWPGPLPVQGGSISYQESEKWARVWYMRRSEVDSFLALSSHTLANTSAHILEWPAKGNPYAKGRNGATLNISETMAPFIDINSDGNYDPLAGDYPLMKGDEMQWLVFNDNGPAGHNELTFANAIGAEVKACVYGYRSTVSLRNILFYEFDILSKQHRLDSFRLGVFADFDLGYANDDYIGYDSALNLAYSYNASMIDGNGNLHEYGDTIPTVGLKFLEFQGNDCNNSASLESMMYVKDQPGNPQGFPVNGREVFQYLQHTWRDSTPLRGYSAHTWGVYSEGYGGGGALKRFVYDNTPIGSSATLWNECQMQHVSGDRKLVIGLPQTQLQAGQHYKLSFALVAANRKKNNGCPNMDLSALFTLSDSAGFYFCHPPLSVEGIDQLPVSYKIYPNPVGESQLYVVTDDVSAQSVTVKVFDILGRKVELPSEYTRNGMVLNFCGLPAGVYYVIGQSSQGRFVERVLKN